MSSARILIVDDEPSIVEFLSVLCGREGYEVSTAGSYFEASESLAARTFDLALCDIMMPDGNGLELLREMRASSDHPPSVVMMTAYTSTKTAIEAMKLGADNYVAKPFDVDELKIVLASALERRRLATENVYLRAELADRYASWNIVGRSASMQRVFDLVDRVSPSDSSVLMRGESGTGKELIARVIHNSSSRARQPFLSINCGALPESLLESELYGYERGAFTGAVRDKKGLFQEASRGTLFLDEISETSPAMQVKLLRTIQEHVVRPVGGTIEEKIDVRIITATNRDLEERIAQGKFREDLYYRINVIPIFLPPLRERREDVSLLIDHFLNRFARELKQPKKRVTSTAMKLLESYDWPGNVRELENLIERAVALSSSDVIDVRDFPESLEKRPANVESSVDLPPNGLDLESLLDRQRVDLMRQALARTGGVQTKAAELLRMTFRSFRYYARKAGLTAAPADEE